MNVIRTQLSNRIVAVPRSRTFLAGALNRVSTIACVTIRQRTQERRVFVAETMRAALMVCELLRGSHAKVFMVVARRRRARNIVRAGVRESSPGRRARPHSSGVEHNERRDRGG